MPLALSQSNPDGGSSPSFCSGRKLSDLEQALWWSLLQEDPQCPSRLLLDEAARRQRPMAVRLRQLNRWRVQWPRNRRQGRPRQTPSPGSAVSGAAVVRIRPRLSFVGVHLLAHGLDHQRAFDLVVAQLTPAIETHKHPHPDADLALLQHREQTLRHRFQALFFAPLFGIEHLTAFDTRAHPLATLLGRRYQSATLTQFLGQLERVRADEALVPTRVPAQAGQMTYIAGPRSASGSRVAMHKGQITMRGRLMAGSPAVMAHNEAGDAVFVAYHPPDSHLSRIIVASCHKVVEAPGSTVCVSDRAVHSLAMAAAFAKPDWGLLGRLDANEHHGLESFEATSAGTVDDGSQVYSGSWKAAKDADPRLFVMVVPQEGQPFVYWGTPQLKATVEVRKGPQLDRERTERQENSCKRLLDHGALETNYGRKKSVGPDRHQQRKREDLEASLETAPQRVANKVEGLQEQQAKVAESQAQGHGKRLAQRQQALRRVGQALEEAQDQQAQCVAQVEA
jgi:hypothetical protein